MSDAPTFDWSVPESGDAAHRLRLGAFLKADEDDLPSNIPAGLAQPDGVLLVTSGALVLTTKGTAGLVTESLGDLSIEVQRGALKVAADVLSTFGARAVVLDARPPVSDTTAAGGSTAMAGGGEDTVTIRASETFDVGEGAKEGTATFQAKKLEINCTHQKFRYDLSGTSIAKGGYHPSTSNVSMVTIYCYVSVYATPVSITVGGLVWYSGVTRVALTVVSHETCGYKYANASFSTGLKGLVNHSLDNAAGNSIVEAQTAGIYNDNTGLKSTMASLRFLDADFQIADGVATMNRMLM